MHRSNASLFHHVGGAGEDRLRHGDPQRFRRFEVDHQFRPTEFVPGVMSRIVVNRYPNLDALPLTRLSPNG
jgi:hypothetical protein